MRLKNLCDTSEIALKQSNFISKISLTVLHACEQPTNDKQEIVAMLKRIPLILLLAFFNSTPSSAALFFYTDEATFNADNPGLSTEDFEGGVVNENFTGPVNSTTTIIGAGGSTIYSAGDILPGVEFGSLRRGNPPFTTSFDLRLRDLDGSVAFSTPAALNFLTIEFGTNVTAVSMDVFQLLVIGIDPNDIAIRVFGNGGLLDQTTFGANDTTPTFFGVLSDSDLITRIEIDDANVIPTVQTLANIAAIDNVAFGTPSAVPVPAAAWLFGTALIGLVGFSKRRKAA